MTPYELAKQYYPQLWPLDRLDKLLELGRITRAEYDDVTQAAEAADNTHNGQAQEAGKDEEK